MTPDLITTQDVVAGIVLGLAGVGAIITALVKLAQTTAHLGHATREVRDQTREVRDQFDPDHGSSLRDAVDRLEAALSRVESTQRGMARDVGRLADSDNDIRSEAHDEHARLWAALDRQDHHHD